MKIVVAIDSFKGSLTSSQAGAAVREAVLRLDGTAEVIVKPLADGGEGTVQALSDREDAELISLTVNGPLMKPVTARYCILKDTGTAVMEMAAASGLTLISEKERNPMKATTYGVGEMIADAVKRGCRKFIVGIGGSATNDGGTGMLKALGFEFLDKNGNPVSSGAEGLRDLYEIRTDKAIPELKDCFFRVACDVKNPLCGERGCSAVFAPQKGASPEDIAVMDSLLENYAVIAKAASERADKNAEGAGAAGGLGFAFLSFLNSELKSGIKLILDETGLDEDVRDADIVVTGEGRLDAQTVMGKAPIGVAALAKKYGKRVIAFSGCVTEDAEICNEYGIDAFFPVVRGVTTLEEALDRDNAYKNLQRTAYQVFRLLFSGSVF